MSQPPIANALAKALSDAKPSGVVSACLFGSHAEDRAHSESDIDVAALLRHRDFPIAKARRDARLTLAAQLMAALKTNYLDLFVLNDAPPLFGRKIVTSGQRLYCSSAEVDHDFLRGRATSRGRPRTISAARPKDKTGGFANRMTFLVDRLVELERYLKHLNNLRPRVEESQDLERDLSLRNDVLFSLLMVCQLVINISGELSAQRGERFEDYTQAIRNLVADARFPARLVQRLEKLPGFRNILVHEYVVLDFERWLAELETQTVLEQAREQFGSD